MGRMVAVEEWAEIHGKTPATIRRKIHANAWPDAKQATLDGKLVWIENADKCYNDWNLAMAAAEGTRQINMVYKKQELFKAVKKVIESCPSIDPDSLQLRWRKTAEEPPKAEDADPRSATVLTVQTGIGFVTAWEWHIVADFPEEFPVWMPLPKKPDLENLEGAQNE